MSKILHQLKQKFLEKWPAKDLENLTLAEYSNLNKDSFTYWIEHIVNDLGSVKGGSSYKFGVYHRSDNTEKDYDNKSSDGTYAWYNKYGSSAEEAFQTVKSLILEVVDAVQKDNLQDIESIDLGHAYKWKIAFLYSDYNVTNLFTYDALLTSANYLDGDPEDKSAANLNRFIIGHKEDKEFYAFMKELWTNFDNQRSTKKSFKKWIEANSIEGSNSANSYLRSINILENELGIPIYTESDLTFLEDLYEDLVSEQKKVDGRYWFAKSTSYNKKGFLSAAVGKYIDFLKSNNEQSLLFGLDLLIENYKAFLRNANKKESTINFYAKTANQLIEKRWRKIHGEKPIINSLSKESLTKIEYVVKSSGAGGKFEGREAFLEFLSQLLSNNNMSQNIPLNKILYGPPGTGKTYKTIDDVVQICDPEKYKTNNRQLNIQRYKELVEEGRVVFTTFHQSLSYEDFVEGIKPTMAGDEESEELAYEVQPGIFKTLVNNAKPTQNVNHHKVDWDNARFFKMSLGGKNSPTIHDWCIENELVGISYGEANDLSPLLKLAQKEDWDSYLAKFAELFPEIIQRKPFTTQIAFIFMRMKKGDIVVVSKGNKLVDAIGIVDGDYDYKEDTPTDMFHFRKVKWIGTDLNASANRFVHNNLIQHTVYNLKPEKIKIEAFKNLTSNVTDPKPHVLIIDEINRGNVSSIFGELITLLEDDKRLGADNEIQVTLPYSQESFAVPKNLYIIGTMNTADRSVEALDTALRRRFAFEECMPNPDLLSPSAMISRLMWKYEKIEWTKEPYASKEKELFEFLGIPEDLKNNKKEIWAQMSTEPDNYDLFESSSYTGYNLKTILEVINSRIEALIDRDHTIGHSYFINLNTEKELKSAFKDKVIPLLQEYFYGDYGKIGLVLGKGFVEAIKTETKQKAFADFNYAHDIEQAEIKYQLKSMNEDFDLQSALKSLINKPEEKVLEQPA